MAAFQSNSKHMSAMYVLLPTIGVFNPNETNSRFHPFVRKLFQYAYRVFLDMSLVQLVVGFSVNFSSDRHNQSYSVQIDTITQIAIYAIVLVLILYYQCRSATCYQLLDSVTALFVERSTRGGPTYVTMTPLLTFIRRASIFYLCLGVGVNQFVVIIPAVQQGRMLLQCWYPFDVEKSPAFQLVFLYQVVGQALLGWGFCMAMLYPLGVALIICAQFEILFASIESIAFIGPDLKNITKETVPVERFPKFKYVSEVVDNAFKSGPYDTTPPNQRLLDCVVLHKQIVQCANSLENIASPVLLFKYLVASGEICLFLFNILLTDKHFDGKVLDAQYLVYGLWDVFALAYMGQIMLNHSVRAGDFLFALPWYRFDREFHRNMMFMQLFSQREVQLTGGKFFVMNYEKFIKIVKMAFSMYTFLNQE